MDEGEPVCINNQDFTECFDEVLHKRLQKKLGNYRTSAKSYFKTCFRDKKSRVGLSGQCLALKGS